MSDTTEPIGRLDPFVGVDIDVDDYEEMLAEQNAVMAAPIVKTEPFTLGGDTGRD